MNVNIPDPQHVMLDALMTEVHRLIDTGDVSKDTAECWFEAAPESVVFTSEDIDRDQWYDEDDSDVIRLVGERDLQVKIDYWLGCLADVARGNA